MAARELVIQCSHQQRMLLAEVIRFYIPAAYPPGGSECAQAAREALLNTAVQLEAVLPEAEQTVISRRMRTSLKAAVAYYAEQHAKQEQTDSLLALLIPG